MPLKPEIPTLEEVQDRVNRSIYELYERDYDLIKLDVNERSITHKLGEYLQQQFPDWNVDCEYNRKGKATKEIREEIGTVQSDDTEGRTIYPDIIVHLRNADNNLLVIEAKKNVKHIDDIDRIKIEYLIECDDFNYQYGCWISFMKKGILMPIFWFGKGV